MQKGKVSSGFALYFIFLIAFAPFGGLLSSQILHESNETQRILFERNPAILSLEELPLRMDCDLVYDTESDRVIFFGGAIETLKPNYTDTWAYNYNTNEWENKSPAVHPPASEWHQTAYHSGQDKVVLFGGHISGTGATWKNHNQTWVYDYNANTWTNMSPILAPPPFSGGGMVYDSESDLIVLFGGFPDGGITVGHISQTWTYDLTSNTWTNMTTSSQPSGRSWVAMAYDIESDLIVLFGGLISSPSTGIEQDTWTYDVDTNTWTEIATEGPEVVGDFAYDSESDRMVFFGGTEGWAETVATIRSETWTYDTNTQTWEMMSLDVKPDPRSRVELTYDSESDRVILYGGVLDGGWPTEEVVRNCWAYDLNNNLWNNVDWDWQEQTPVFSPGNRTGAPIVYDIESDRMVIFSGWPNLHYDGVRYNDTWTYDYNSNTWTNMSPAVMPVGRGAHSMVYNQKADVVIMFGGVAGWQGDSDYVMADTWTYNLNTNIWTNMSPASNPSPRVASALGYDNKSDIIVLFGGWMPDWSANHETWLYNLTSNTWTNVTTANHPVARFYGNMIYDYKNDRLLLVGGSNWDGVLHDMWAFDFASKTWTEIVAANDAPIPAFGVTYDSESELVVAYCTATDLSEDVLVKETWTFNLTSRQWNNTWSPNSPRERSRQYMAYDMESDRTIMYGGGLPDGQQGEAIGDTWAYNYKINPPFSKPNPPENLAVNPSGNSFAITWEAPVPQSGVAIIGYDIYRGTVSGVYELIAELGDVLTYTDLTAGFGITYYYAAKAISPDGESEYSNEDDGILPFVPYGDEISTFIAYGDTRSAEGTGVSPMHDDIVSKYLQFDPELILHTGDLVAHGGEPDNWPLFDESISAISDWDADLKCYYAAGNHEKYTKDYGPEDEDFSNYLSYVDFSDVVNGSEGETELYYSFDWQNIHFIFLNTIDGWTGDSFACPQAQWDWLNADLLSNDKEFIVVSMHNPSYSIRAERTDRWAQANSIRATFHELFQEEGVDIVFSGHDHQYYRTFRDGIQYVVTGGGGAPLYDIQTVGTVWQAGDVGFSEYHYCVCQIDESASTLTVKVYLLNGTIADSFASDLPTTTPAEPFPLLPIIVFIGATVAVIIVVALIIQRRR